MSSLPSATIIVVSLEVQSSFQAVPLGAASIVSALKADVAISSVSTIILSDFSLESPLLQGLSPQEQGNLIAQSLVSTFNLQPASHLIAGFSLYVWNRPVLEYAAKELALLLPSVILFAGGPEVTSGSVFYSDEKSNANTLPPIYYLSGEGESSTCTLIHLLLENKKIPSSLLAPNRSPSENCAALVSPWLEGTLENCEGVLHHKGALWELARGCPYSCTYCCESKGEKKVRSFPLERLEKELEYFIKIGIERVFVLDPTYNASKERALRLLDLIFRKAPEIHFNFEVRAELLDAQLVAAFSKIPCSLQIGLQSSNPEALKAVNRPCDFKSFTKKIGLLNNAGIIFGLDLMYGLPKDSFSTFRNSIDFAVSQYPNNLEVFRLAVLPGTLLAEQAEGFGMKYAKTPPYLVESTPQFSHQDLERAASLARACDLFYTQGRCVTWFNAALVPLKLKASQFFQDFATFLLTVPKIVNSQEIPHTELEKLQLSFLKAKYTEKQKAFLWPVLRDIICLHGAWTRALAEGDETLLELSYHPEDLFSTDSMDLVYFTENACMEQCSVRVYSGPEGPDLELL
ncbi:MAG TPA: B12-binding domain-containing radical SAM protein [Treponemataceae bacterium]|nr:B12-binding domain-containing radical SAM protein [Treponemataceae bacterium]